MLRHVEESLEQLQSRLSDSHRELIEAARAEARAAVNELSASLDGRGINSDLIRALRQDLDSLRAATENGSASAAEPKPVDQTLTQVVDRLDQLERATVERATGTHGPATGRQSGTQRIQGKTGGRRAAKGANRRPTRRLHRRRAPRRTGGGRRGASHRGACRRGTRRRGEPKAGAFARISQAIRNRKRPAAARRRGDRSGHRRRQALRHRRRRAEAI